MRLLRVVDWGTSANGDVTLDVKGADDRACRVEMPLEVALEMVLALRHAVSELSPTLHAERAVIEVARCVEVVSIGRRLGVVLETSEGVELPLALDQAAVESLSSCMRGDRLPSAVH